MNIKPSDNWRWYFDKERDCLMLDLSDEIIFRSKYSSKILKKDAFNQFEFSLENANSYYQFYESCNGLPLSEPLKVELALNAIVAQNYLKPQMPKSWYFVQQPMLFQPSFGEVVDANIQDSGEKLALLCVDTGELATLCVIAQTDVIMAGKQFEIGDVIKVMNDRLAPRNYISQNKSSIFDEDENLKEFLYRAI